MDIKKFFIILFLILLISSSLLYYKFNPDDFYIYLEYAKNLNNNYELAFNLGEKSYGFTSPIWLFLLSIIYTESLIILFSKILCLVLLSLSIIFYFKLSKSIFPDYICYIGLILLFLNPWVLRWSLSGMETVLIFFLTIVFLYLFLEDSKLSWLPASIFPLVRPELIIWVIVFGFWIFYEQKNKRIKQILFLFLPFLTWSIFSFFYFGRVFPNTAHAKSSGFSVITAYRAFKKTISTLQPVDIFVLFVFIFLLVISICKKRKINKKMLFVFVLIVSQIALYIINGVNVYTRYLVPVFPLSIYLFQKIVSKKRLIAFLITGISLIYSIFISYFYIYPATINYINSEKNVNKFIGEYLKDNTKKDTSIFLWDIGAIGYYSNRYIFDLNGIINKKILNRKKPYFKWIEEEILKKRKTLYFVDVSYKRKRFMKVDNITFEQKFMLAKPFINMFIFQKRPLYYSVYKVHPKNIEP